VKDGAVKVRRVVYAVDAPSHQPGGRSRAGRKRRHLRASATLHDAITIKAGASSNPISTIRNAAHDGTPKTEVHVVMSKGRTDGELENPACRHRPRAV